MKKQSGALGGLLTLHPAMSTPSDNEPAKPQGPSLLRRRESLIVGAILVASFLSHFATVSSSGFLSDESVYSYAAYAIGRGVVPYAQIMLAHPPIGYLSLIIPVILAQGNVVLIRIYNLGSYLLIAVISFWFYRALREGSSGSFGSLASLALFSLYPTSFAMTTPIEFTVFDIPILLASVFFVTGITRGSNRRLLVSGLFVGIASMIWYPAAFFAISLLGFLVAYHLGKHRNQPRLFPLKQLLSLAVGAGSAVALVLMLILSWGALPNFFAQTVTFESIRAGFILGERLRHIGLAVSQFLPMFVLAAVGGLELVRRVRNGADTLVLLPVWVVLVNLGLLFTIPKIVLNHYVVYLTPFIAFIAAGPVERLVQMAVSRNRAIKRGTYHYFHGALAVSMIAIVILTYPFGSAMFQTSPYTVSNQAVGQYVMSITLPNETIWTSEGGIAYFATRLIQAPNSTTWPFQAAYNDIFSATYVDSDGISHNGLGVVSPADFVNAWQSHGTKVLVFILGDGPVPYPDDFLWNGFPGTGGVATWVGQNYREVKVFTFPNVSYQYFVWLMK